MSIVSNNSTGDESQSVHYDGDSAFWSFQTLPPRGLSGLVVTKGWENEISVRHTDLVTPRTRSGNSD